MLCQLCSKIIDERCSLSDRQGQRSIASVEYAVWRLHPCVTDLAGQQLPQNRVGHGRTRPGFDDPIELDGIQDAIGAFRCDLKYPRQQRIENGGQFGNVRPRDKRSTALDQFGLHLPPQIME
ncbi:hypothetical protein [Hyphomicrobium denitrificans]|uniref:hypothetical protein n=1 Tax=Hyphomicrobium denitrificans TaxID=53399 RepID=UPI0011819C8C|nr:hypothetical protein [Hyphomicrobium denitrificans]